MLLGGCARVITLRGFVYIGWRLGSGAREGYWTVIVAGLALGNVELITVSKSGLHVRHAGAAIFCRGISAVRRIEQLTYPLQVAMGRAAMKVQVHAHLQSQYHQSARGHVRHGTPQSQEPYLQVA